MSSINVVVNGVSGRMGQEVLRAMCREPDMVPVGGADPKVESDSMDLPDGSGSIPISSSLLYVLGGAQVVVDFTNAEGALDAIRTAAPEGVNVVVGSTGIPDAGFEEAGDLARIHGVGVFIAPNFAFGAVLMAHLARVAAPYFDYADLTELHHEMKIDAPSGTAIAIAKAAAEGKGGDFTAPQAEKEIIPGTRGGTSQGVVIHSARMPGLTAHHQLVLGALGQTLTIRHDSINRESFMPGVAMAVRHVVSNPGLTVGLDKIMGL